MQLASRAQMTLDACSPMKCAASFEVWQIWVEEGCAGSRVCPSWMGKRLTPLAIGLMWVVERAFQTRHLAMAMNAEESLCGLVIGGSAFRNGQFDVPSLGTARSADVCGTVFQSERIFDSASQTKLCICEACATETKLMQMN
jgi:hypothetical protein